jgi:polysaccharide biosynthesis/export protein
VNRLGVHIFGLLAGFLFLAYPGHAFPQQQRVAPNPTTASANISAMSVAPQVKDEPDRPTPAERYPRYHICRDDVISLAFPLTPELNQKVTVQPDGFISLQSAGSLYIAGLTVPELENALKKAYSGILHDPIINIDLVDFQKPFFTVLGQVGKPGQYDLRYDMTVTQAIAVAGGFAESGKTQIFLFHAVSSNWAEVRELKLKDLLNGKNITEDVHLRPGDMLFVPEKSITKFKRYVPYSFNLSPPYSFNF